MSCAGMCPSTSLRAGRCDCRGLRNKLQKPFAMLSSHCNHTSLMRRSCTPVLSSNCCCGRRGVQPTPPRLYERGSCHKEELHEQHTGVLSQARHASVVVPGGRGGGGAAAPVSSLLYEEDGLALITCDCLHPHPPPDSTSTERRLAES